MRVRTYVDISQEIEISVSWDDFWNSFQEECSVKGDHKQYVLRALNTIGGFLRSVTDEQIEAMDSAPRLIVKKFLAEQSKRYEKEVS